MADFDSIVGQEIAKKLLNSAIKNNRVAHAYLFIGPSNLGKFKLAVEFAKIIQGYDEHNARSSDTDRAIKIAKGADPDILVIDPAKSDEGAAENAKNISIEEVRSLEHHLSLFPYRSKYKIAIINAAHKFTPEAANAFLKTLEEPRGNSLIVLIAEARHLLPETLISRTQVIRFWPVRDEAIADFLTIRGLKREKAAKIAAISQGKPGMAFRFAEAEKELADRIAAEKIFYEFIAGNLEERFSFAEKMAKDEEKTQRALRLWLSFLRGMILKKYFAGNYPATDKASVETGRLVKFANGLNLTINLITNSNVNKKLALENLAIEIPTP